jgi:hypothetical protein
MSIITVSRQNSRERVVTRSHYRRLRETSNETNVVKNFDRCSNCLKLTRAARSVTEEAP